VNATMPSSSAADALARRYLVEFPADAAERLEAMEPAAAAAALAGIPADLLGDMWEALAPGFASLVFRDLDRAQRVALLTVLDRSRATQLLSLLDDDDCEAHLAMLDADVARDLRLMLSYPEDTAGRIMDTRVFTLHEHVTAGNALTMLRQRGRGELLTIKLLDADNRLSGQVDLRDLAFADTNAPLATLSAGISAVVGAMDPRSLAVEKFEQYNLQEIPVLDIDGRVLGVIRHSQLLGALRNDATLDMQTMVGAGKDERALSASWFAIRKRMPWMQINLLTAFLAASVVGMFESTIAKYTALAVLLPVVAGQSGNAGAQALAVTMRGLALREIHFGQWLRIVRKEVNTGFWNGISIAVTCAIGVYVWSGSAGLVLVISISMIISMVMAGIAGALVPITLARLGQDPAVASSIILTTVTDVAGFLSFLGIATALSGMLG